jgi:hypothetical protein
VDAANDGDRITIAPGTFDGGITIDVSVALVGAGADRTVIRGGGPVLTIGTFGASSEPAVSIKGVKVTGGVTRTSPESIPFTGEEGVYAAGGGIEIPPNADFSGGATVRIRDSVIARNLVAPTRTAPFGPTCPNGDPCPFAFAGGGGINSWGTTKLVETTVQNNLVGSASGLSTKASDADGGGIVNHLGPLTLKRSTVRGNEATATGRKGRFAEGGGILVDGAALTIRDSSVTANRAALEASLPNGVDQLAIGGGLQIGKVPTVGIKNTKISGNSVATTNSIADAVAFSGGLNLAHPAGIDFHMNNAVISRNAVRAAALNPSGGDAEGDTGGAALKGVVANVRLRDNTVRVKSTAGAATAAAGASLIGGRMTDSAAIGNSVHAKSPAGTALAAGGAFVVDRRLTLRGTTVRANTAFASGQSGKSRGGGIFDAPLFSDGGRLVLVDSDVLQNVATGSPKITLQGGGLYIHGQTSTLIRSALEQNVPDQCFGC